MKWFTKKFKFLLLLGLFFFSFSSVTEVKADCPEFYNSANACINYYMYTFFYPCLADPASFGYENDGACYEQFVMVLVPDCYLRCD